MTLNPLKLKAPFRKTAIVHHFPDIIKMSRVML